VGKAVLIGDFLHRIKRPIELLSSVQYKLVTIKLKHNGVVLRHEKLGSEIKSKMFEVKEGDFILSGIDARNGAFGIVPKDLDGAIVTNDFWYFDIDESIVDKHFFLELTTTLWFDEICRKGSDGTTQRIRLQKNKFFNQEIFLPELDEQREFIEIFKRLKNVNNDLSIELSEQQILLKKLRQQILQEAIEGKLTVEFRMKNQEQLRIWNDELRQVTDPETIRNLKLKIRNCSESAASLLARIKLEKEQLIKAKKIKKQKALPPITDEEKPFDLPDGWVWCRLNNLFNFIDYRGKTPRKLTSGIRLITARNVKNDTLSLEPEDFISEDEYKERMTRGFPKKGDLLFTTEAPLGNTCMLNVDGEKISTGQRLITLQAHHNILENKMVMFFILSPFYQGFLIEKATGMTAKGIKSSKLKEMIIPTPPLSEQRNIVAKVEKLLATCDQLEAQITNNQIHSNQLMQSVLKEAFQQSDTKPQEKEYAS